MPAEDEGRRGSGEVSAQDAITVGGVVTVKVNLSLKTLVCQKTFWPPLKLEMDYLTLWNMALTSPSSRPEPGLDSSIKFWALRSDGGI